jgi:uncharacterized membrane protein YedE/YeeE
VALSAAFVMGLTQTWARIAVLVVGSWVVAIDLRRLILAIAIFVDFSGFRRVRASALSGSLPRATHGVGSQ